MLKSISFFLVICAYVVNAAHLTQQPNFIKSCKSKDTKCLTASMQSMFRQLNSDIPGLKNVPRIDPFKIKKINIDQDRVQAVNISAVLTNAEFKGMRDLIVKRARYNREKGILSFDMILPKLEVVSDYSVRGRALILQLNSHGKMFFSAENVESTLNVLAELRDIDDEKFLYIKALRIHYKPLNAYNIKLDNLFNGNKALEDSANQLFNENSEVLIPAFQPMFEQVTQNSLLPIMKRIFLYIPAKFIISDL